MVIEEWAQHEPIGIPWHTELGRADAAFRGYVTYALYPETQTNAANSHVGYGGTPDEAAATALY